MTENQCFDPLKADLRYPPLPRELTDNRLSQDIQTTENELKGLFRGTWYISAGLNPAYDTFDCQIHNFYESKSKSTSSREGRRIIADAIFSYRVPTETTFFTKEGPKRLELVSDVGVQGTARSQHPIFESGQKWGMHQFELGMPEDSGHITNGYHLQLTLLPSTLNYKDEWTILSYSNDEQHGYIVLAYRGVNSAFEGYGGLNVYTLRPTQIKELLDARTRGTPSEREMTEGIEAGLRKLSLSLDDLKQVDNSCPDKRNI